MERRIIIFEKSVMVLCFATFFALSSNIRCAAWRVDRSFKYRFSMTGVALATIEFGHLDDIKFSSLLQQFYGRCYETKSEICVLELGNVKKSGHVFDFKKSAFRKDAPLYANRWRKMIFI